MKQILIVCLVILGCSVHAFSELVNFNLLGDSAIYSRLDNQSTAIITNNGLIATFTASAGGVMNRTTSGFGINGSGSDDTHGLNTGQYIQIIFDQDVTFTNLNISSWGALDAGEVQLGPAFTSQGSISGTGDTLYNFTVSQGTAIRIIATADTASNNGFSVDGFTVAIPEPSSAALITITAGLLFIIRRKLRI